MKHKMVVLQDVCQSYPDDETRDLLCVCCVSVCVSWLLILEEEEFLIPIMSKILPHNGYILFPPLFTSNKHLTMERKHWIRLLELSLKPWHGCDSKQTQSTTIQDNRSRSDCEKIINAESEYHLCSVLLHDNSLELLQNG